MTETYEIHERIAVIALNNPPVNALGLGVRTGFMRAFRAACADSLVDGIVLIGAGRVFSGGADIREFASGEGFIEPTLHDLIETVESSSKLVLAAIDGLCMGGGLELALACHARIARSDAKLALPEVKLGLLPGAGGTQRLPRLVPGSLALRMVVRGETLSARSFEGTDLLDAHVEGELFEAALRLARSLAHEKNLRRTRDRPMPPPSEEFLQECEALLQSLPPQYPAPRACVEAIRMAFTLPIDAGLAREKALFHELMQTEASAALRHAFFAERAAAKIPDIPETVKPRSIQTVGVVGAGTMGTGISMNFLNAGLPVTLMERDAAALDRGVATIRKLYEGSVKKGKLTAEALEQRLGLLKPALNWEALADADLIIEAVYENLDLKQEVFRTLDRVAKPTAILATNTSTLDVDAIAAVTSRPSQVLGLHFFSPAHVMRLLEVVRGAQTAPDVLVTAMALARTIQKTAVVSRVCEGFIGNRMIAAYTDEAMKLLDEGASPQAIDRALEDFGMAMGPFRMSDLAGLDVGWAIREQKRKTVPDPEYPRLADRLYERGRYGQKTGAGWYRYTADRREASVDPIVDDMIRSYREEKGLNGQSPTAEAIVARCMRALAREGEKILDEGIAQRASDIDIVYLAGYGFPAFRGGPMFYAKKKAFPTEGKATTLG